MYFRIARFSLGLTLFTCILTAARASAVEPVPLDVLFLGDEGHHRPADRAAQLTPVMAGRGIEITYTYNLIELNPENLARYDALLLYANIERIEPREEKAL